jgi:Rap1a immunity proteins
MKMFSALILLFMLCSPSWAEPASADNAYIVPYPHSNGADLLAYCERTDEVVSQLRCDYYVQGVADLATMPLLGELRACIPQGQNRTQLMQTAVSFLKTVKPDALEEQSAARLILKGFKAAFPCATEEAIEADKKAEGKVPD